MAEEIILQHWIFTRFLYPFLLMFFLSFAILIKTKVLGEEKQLNALIAFVISFIFVSVAYPTEVASNLILFLTIAMVVVFVGLLLWGFVSGAEKVEIKTGWVKWAFGIAVIVSVFFATVWATGSDSWLYTMLFKQSWSSKLWTNVAFIFVIGIALAAILKNWKKS